MSDTYFKEVTLATYGGRMVTIDFTKENVRVEGSIVRTLERLTDMVNEKQRKSGFNTDPIVRWVGYELETRIPHE